MSADGHVEQGETLVERGQDGRVALSLRAELDGVRDDLVRLGAMVVEAIQAGTEALLTADLAVVEQVVSDDRAIDRLTHRTEHRALSLLAEFQPEGAALRELVGTLRILFELERTGDLMRNVARSARRLYPNSLSPRVRGIVDRMCEQATLQMRLAIEAIHTLDPARGAAIADMDDVMDDLQRQLFRELIEGAARNPDRQPSVDLQRAVEVALIGRFYERTADHAVNIGDRVVHMATGRFPDGTPELDEDDEA